MDQHESENRLKRLVKGLDNYLVREDYQEAIQFAQDETGWTLPQTDSTRIYWFLNRSVRHLLFMLQNESAHKFKVKQYNLQQRHFNYSRQIEYMDKVYLSYLEGTPDDTFRAFGTKIDAGFAYSDLTGRDITYSEDQRVIFTPTETD